ncbi:pyridoxamine 5'-phosphate oxidase family protein [Ruegeria arenilitoris]|uniref:pyridoxamine 5'-phosphate oxidase family protein n=1 Tax=Ruegeria arenilitoris TaxID=1173585 RepID=UPI0014799969|nr:pyridoxamine 5'-phosphate oxidase family protein [Ruegeria arenilitoris]
MPYEPQDVVTTEEELRTIVPNPPSGTQDVKIIDHIDKHCRVWIERSPFLVLATSDSTGRLDCSPKGDPAGFVKVIDEKTLAIPDRPGNRRFDGFINIMQTGRVGLIFFVPNRNETVRVNGTAQVVRDQPLLESMAINGRVPELAVLVSVEEAFYHCGKAIIRAALWVPEKAVPIDGLPTYAEANVDHTGRDYSLEQVTKWFDDNEKYRLYDD